MNWEAVAAITAVAVAAAGGLLFAWRKVAWPLISGGLRFLEDWFGERARPGVPARPGVMERLQNVETLVADVRAETMPNGGHSLRDVVHQTAADVLQARTAIAGVLARMNTLEQQRQQRDNHQTGEPPA